MRLRHFGLRPMIKNFIEVPKYSQELLLVWQFDLDRHISYLCQCLTYVFRGAWV